MAAVASSTTTNAAHWWWLRKFPLPYVKRFEVPGKALYKCNKLLLLLLKSSYNGDHFIHALDMFDWLQ